MSLVNFSVTPSAILVSVDTLGGSRGHHLHCNKLFPIPGGNMLLCGRGSLGLMARAAELCGFLPGLDEAKEQLPRELPGLLRRLTITAFLCGLPKCAFLGGQEIYLFGWSEQYGEMTALQFRKGPGRSAWTVDDELVDLAAPRTDTDDLPSLGNKTAMRNLARAQIAIGKRDYPGVPIGGRLLFAELTRYRLQVEDCGPINDAPCESRPMIAGVPSRHARPAILSD